MDSCLNTACFTLHLVCLWSRRSASATDSHLPHVKWLRPARSIKPRRGPWHRTGVPQVGHTRWNPVRVPVDLLTFRKRPRLWRSLDWPQRTWLPVQIISRKTHKSSHKCARGHMRSLQMDGCMLPVHTAWAETLAHKATTDILLYVLSSVFAAYFVVKWLETLTRCQFSPPEVRLLLRSGLCWALPPQKTWHILPITAKPEN